MKTRIRMALSTAAGAAIAAGLTWAKSAHGRRAIPRLKRRLLRKGRYWAGHAQGWWYRLAKRGPSEDVSDAVLLQRMRSELGSVLKRMDLPDMDVHVTNGDVEVSGVVSRANELRKLRRLMQSVPGVRILTMDIRIGFGPDDRRPSEGRAHATSDLRRDLRQAARDAGFADEEAPHAISAVLDVFLSLIPEGERRHVLTHFPGDVRELTDSQAPPDAPKVSDEATLFAAVAASGAVDVNRAERTIRGVLDVLRHRIPEEADDIAAVLPAGLQALWAEPMAQPSSPTTPDA